MEPEPQNVLIMEKLYTWDPRSEAVEGWLGKDTCCGSVFNCAYILPRCLEKNSFV